MAEVERKVAADERITDDDLAVLQAAYDAHRRAQPQIEYEVIEDGWQATNASSVALTAWHKQSLADSLSGRVPPGADPDFEPRDPNRPVRSFRGTTREQRGRRARTKSAARGDPDREPPLTRLQLARRLISDARRARIQSDWRECPTCLREQEPTEFRSRRICRSCESKARLARLQAAA